MKNTYIVIGVVVIIAILGFVFSKKGVQPNVTQNQMEENENKVAGPIESGDYTLESEASSVQAKAQYLTGESEVKNLSIQSGSFSVVDGVVATATAVISIGEDGKTAVFSLKTFEPLSNYSTSPSIDPNRYVVSGDLTANGIKVTVSFPVTIVNNLDGSVSMKSFFALNKSYWGFTTERDIKDAVEITLDLKAVKE